MLYNVTPMKFWKINNKLLQGGALMFLNVEHSFRIQYLLIVKIISIAVMI
jgi:hypothetical protein